MTTILIVDDDISNLTMYEILVQSMGYEILSLSQPGAVIDLVIAKKPDIILLDLLLGGPINGWDLAREIRALNIPVKIIALTAASLSFRKEAVFNAGCDAYLAKPVSRQQLADAFAQVLESGNV